MLNPTAFFKVITKHTPFQYQQRILQDENQRIAVRAGRQIGKSEAVAVKALHFALISSGKQVLVLAPTLRQSSIIFNKIDAFIQTNPSLFKYIVRKTQTYIQFDNGSEIYCLPSGDTGDTIRGFSPNMIIIDEAAFVKDLVFTAIEPSLAAKNGKLLMISTPFGERGKFYETFSPDSMFIKYHIPSTSCPMITEDFLKEQQMRRTEMEYKQEYMGEFISEADAWLRLELVIECIADIWEEAPESSFRYILGCDIARFGLDSTVYTIAKYYQDQIHIVNIIETKKMPITDVIGRIKALHKNWNFQSVVIDETGLGGGAVDLLREAKLPIIPFTFTSQSKENIYKNMKILMEQGKLKFPNNEKLIYQLKELQYKYTSEGHLKLEAPERGHDDFPDSLALSCSRFTRRRRYEVAGV